MLDRLSNRHQTRLDNSLTCRSTESKSDSSSSPPFESTSTFLSRFSNSKSSIESQLAQCRLCDSTQVKSHFNQISSSIFDLENLVAKNSYFLPSYEKQTHQKRPIAKPKEDEKEQEPEKKSGFRVIDSPGFRNKKEEILVHNFKGSEVGEFSISDLDSCEVRLMGSVRALFVHRLRNCRVYTGPVTGSILVDSVEGCVFVMASHQIRIHNAKTSDFYLRVRSRPIIEDSCGVRFAPYYLTYKGIEEELREANLDEETEKWSNVDDFLWLRAVQSPNWSVLPENDRLGLVDISKSEES
ncbi:hypothetical protein C1H46_034941 [Malus baccata]|uniref:C-CAP/cofactor C-like domain-containing protein n=1 Tax=Malus baccata TaxID=106549 RepID=A0A540KZU0_MALBA|nr:hypothetical protein C1H46_034941 [Malus baccata]